MTTVGIEAVGFFAWRVGLYYIANLVVDSVEEAVYTYTDLASCDSF